MLCGSTTPAIANAPSAGDPPDAWRRATELEGRAFALLEEDPERARSRYLEAGRRYQALAEAGEGGVAAFWRAARCYWFAGEILPVEERDARLESYAAAERMAARGIEVDPECAECMLWKFIAMGRIGIARGLVAGIRAAPQMAELLDHAIALAPTHRDGADNSTLGNLHYGSAIFYRVLPDWTWLGWLLGVRGDKERALGHARTALSLHPARIDYRVELGSQLLCLGTSEEREELLSEGMRLLENVFDRETRSLRDQRQLAAAEVMLAAPNRACGFTGDAWVEIDARQAAAAAAAGDD